MSVQLSGKLEPLSFDQLAGWQDEDHLAAFSCFRLSAGKMHNSPYKTKSMGVSAGDLMKIGNKSLDLSITSAAEAKRFFEENFRPYQYPGRGYHGFLTGYFEPELAASRRPTSRFRFPVYRRPDDLIALDDANRPANMDATFVFGRQTKSGIEEYYDRGQIQNGILEGQNLELAWMEDPVDVFFIHIQGSARLHFDDGSRIGISFAAKSGHPYTPIGKILVDRGELDLEDVTMQSIRSWIDSNSDKQDELLAENRSYIFFQISDHPGSELGPIGAAGVALTAGRSLAVDHKIHTFGTPFWVETRNRFVGSSRPFRRLLISQDTGSAIIGGQRGDLFTGSGREAGLFAGQIKHAASMNIFVPNPEQGR
ncbi:MAG: transglycosylase [Hyphomicrobiales bacterium]|nr:transglycosylase [Hyphomicrobiales bacterium]